MSRLTKLTGATNLDLSNQDFLKVNPMEEKFCDVHYILLDPSCSGSGIVSRLNHLTNDDQSDSQDKLESLARVQTALLSHALSFPNVNRVIYSTCSVHRRENEEVVKEALDSHPEFQLEWALPSWKNRGIWNKDHTDAGKNPSDSMSFDFQACLRAVPKEDLTIGFFVALFERKDSSINKKESPCERTAQNGEEELKKVGQHKKRRNKRKSVEISKEIVDMDDSKYQNKNESLLETRKSKKRNRKRRKKTQGESDSKKKKLLESMQQKAVNLDILEELRTAQEAEGAVNDNAKKVNKRNKAKGKRKGRQKTATIS